MAVVVLQLAADHRLRLDDTIDRWLPAALRYGNQVTIRSLLNHTSGVPDYGGQLVQINANQPSSWLRHFTPEQLLALVATQPPEDVPGTGWHYSNTDYLLLGMIIEGATGLPLAAQIQRRILAPLHLRDTSSRLTRPPCRCRPHMAIYPSPTGPWRT